MRNKLTQILILFGLLFSTTISFAQNANWGTGLPISANLNGSYLNLSVYDPIIFQTKNTTLNIGSGGYYYNEDGVVVGTSNNTYDMFYATYDLDLHSWKTGWSQISGSSSAYKYINTSNGIVVGTSDATYDMDYAIYDPVIHTWKTGWSQISGSSTAYKYIKTKDGVVVGTSDATYDMDYATYNPLLHTWQTGWSQISGNSTAYKYIETADGVVAGTSDATYDMDYATFDPLLNSWRTGWSQITGNSTSYKYLDVDNGVVVGAGGSGYVYTSIYDFALQSWKTSNAYLGTSGSYYISNGYVSCSGYYNGKIGYNANNHTWGNQLTTPKCTLLVVSDPSTDWIYVYGMTIGSGDYVIGCGDGHIVYRKCGWKKYFTSGNYSLSLNATNGINNTTCSDNVSICGPAAVAGTASSSVSSVCPGLNVILSLSGYAGSIQWEQSSNGTNYTAITGATNSSVVVNPTATTYYRAKVSTGGLPCSADVYSNVKTITVNAAVGGTANASQNSICSGGNISLSLSGQNGNIQWQQSTNGTNYSNINGATSSTLNQTPTTTTYYRAVVSNSCGSDNSTVAMVVVNVCTGVETNLTQEIQLFPNPASNIITLLLDEEASDIAVSILDITGKEIKNVQEKNSKSISVDITTYPAGIYIMQVETNTKKHISRFIKQ